MSLTGAKIGKSFQTTKLFCRNLCQTPANLQFCATMSETAFLLFKSRLSSQTAGINYILKACHTGTPIIWHLTDLHSE